MPKLKAQKCARCGKRLTYPLWVKSSWGNYYCTDLTACGKRAKRKKGEKS